jgi:Secretion system C-terminal sorting domain/Beta-propeller repeat
MKKIYLILLLIFIFRIESRSQIWQGVIMNGGDSIINKHYDFIRNKNNPGSFMVGGYKGIVDFGLERSYSSLENFNAYITYFPDPLIQIASWIVELGGPGNQFIKGIDLDNNGNIYTIGTFDTSIYLGSQPTNCLGLRDIFIAKYDTLGNAIWYKIFGTINDEDLTNISVDYAGNFIVSGRYTNSISFGSINISNTINPNKATDFIAKFDRNGTCIWAKSIYSNSSKIIDIKADSNNDYAILSSFKYEYVIDNIIVTTNEVDELYALTKINASSTVLWSKQIPGAVFNDNFQKGWITVDELGSIYMTGSSKDGFNSSDIIVSKFDPNGNSVWERTFGSNGEDKGKAIEYFNGYISLLGFFDKQIIFDNITLSEDCTIDNESFIATLNANNGFINGVEQMNNDLEQNGMDKMHLLALDYMGNISMSGFFTKSANLDFQWALGTAGFGRITIFMGNKILGYSKTKNTKIEIFPNPVIGSILFIKNADAAPYEIINTLGQVLQRGNIENGSINVSALSSGLYILKTDKGYAKFEL